VHIYGLNGEADNVILSAASIAQEVSLRHAADVDANGRFPEESVAALAKQGLMGLCVPKEMGGKGQGPQAFAGVVEELAQGCGSTAMIYVMHVAATQTIASSTTLKDREDLLRQIAAGKHLTTLALSERGSRSQFWAPVSKLSSSGDIYTTSAYKSWVTAADHADSYVSSAQKPDAISPLESTLYLARNGDKEISVGGDFDGMGLRGNGSAPLIIQDLIISQGDLITEQGAGAKTILEVVLPWFAIGTAAMANGLCLAARSATTKHLQEVGFEHTGTKLRDLPNLRARVAQMSVRTEQARALLGYTLSEVLNPSESTPLFLLQARLASIDAAVEVTELAMKTCGGAAFSKHLAVERLFRDARAGWVMAPTVDHLNDFIGKALTGLPLFE
jgi:alkylation response protein AidB-like acyl-CoA dehydrogenase